MAVVLTEGAAQLIHDGGLTGSATLQCIGVKAVKEKIYRWRLRPGALPCCAPLPLVPPVARVPH